MGVEDHKPCTLCDGEGGFKDGMCGRCKGSGVDNGDPEPGWRDPDYTPPAAADPWTCCGVPVRTVGLSVQCQGACGRTSR